MTVGKFGFHCGTLPSTTTFMLDEIISGLLSLEASTEIPLSKKPYIGGLDLVRFFAASLVLMYHLTFVSWDSPFGPNFRVVGTPEYPELPIFRPGWVGVEIFFVLSGFVIAQSADGRSAYEFFRGRLRRLLPASWICASITFAIVLYFGFFDFNDALMKYLRALVIHRNGPWITGIYWTLAIEVSFYITICLLLLFNAFRYVETFALALGACSIVYLFGLLVFKWSPIRGIFLAQHGVLFSLGILIWLSSSRGVTPTRIAACTVAVTGCIMEIVYGHNHLENSELCFAIVLWLGAMIAICASVWSANQGNHFTRTLGLMTYPIYLVHEYFGAVVLRITPWAGKYLALAVAVAMTTLLSWAVVLCEPWIGKRITSALDWLVGFVPLRMMTPLSRRTAPVVTL